MSQQRFQFLEIPRTGSLIEEAECPLYPLSFPVPRDLLKGEKVFVVDSYNPILFSISRDPPKGGNPTPISQAGPGIQDPFARGSVEKGRKWLWRGGQES
jgi:hypothetical protein